MRGDATRALDNPEDGTRIGVVLREAGIRVNTGKSGGNREIRPHQIASERRSQVGMGDCTLEIRIFFEQDDMQLLLGQGSMIIGNSDPFGVAEQKQLNPAT